MREIRARADDELREDPAPGEDVIGDHRVAVVVRGAGATERLKEGVTSGGPIEQRAGLTEDREARVVPLDVLRRADASVRIRRIARGDEPGKPHTDTVEAHARWGRRRDDGT